MSCCDNCGQNLGMYKHFYHYEKTYMCQHMLKHIGKNVCATCNINNQRRANGLPKISKQTLKSKSCVDWMTGNSKHRYCWKTLNTKNCDAPNCNDRAIMTDNYSMIYQIIEEVKMSIYFPSGIFDIIFNQLFPEVCGGNNGLCVGHDNIYSKCNDCVFNDVPMCKPCDLWLGNDLTKIMKCCNRNISHHHKTLQICSDLFGEKIYIVDGVGGHSSGWCLDMCRQFGTWCDICNRCIGHPDTNDYCDKRNITNYPHCLVCGEHSSHNHCSKCGKHSECVCNSKSESVYNSDSEYKNNESKLCEQCYDMKLYRHSKLPHCIMENCREHSEFPHCAVKRCNKHSKFPHCVVKICYVHVHSEFPHCAPCNLHH